MDNSLIRFSDVSIAFKGNVVLSGLAFDVKQGESLCITGPSGSGKTVLLKLCAGLLQPTEGAVHRTSLPPRKGACATGAGFVFEYGGLISNMTVFQNVALPLRYHTSMSEEEIASKVHAMLARLKITEFSDALPAGLSLGTRKLASMARAIAMQPRIIYYDEPTLGLDRASVRMVETVMCETREKNEVTSVVVSHSVGFMRRFADRVIVLGRGAILAIGTVAELAASQSPDVRSFLVETEE
jgi:phospholipid/cholesterol/gamma-HCH transport system ATP-binding protein